jgi:hypothetical protein
MQPQVAKVLGLGCLGVSAGYRELSYMLLQCEIPSLTSVIRMPDAEVVSSGFHPWVGHLGILVFSWGRSQRNCTFAISENNLRTYLPIVLWWVEYVDDERSAHVVKSLSIVF